jgi:hypothetical protein
MVRTESLHRKGGFTPVLSNSSSFLPLESDEHHPDSATTSHSAGSPSSIVDLYTRRSRLNQPQTFD